LLHRIHLPLSSLRRATSSSCPLAAQPPPLIVSRCRRLSRCHRLLSAGADTSCCTAVASRPLNDPLPLVCKCLPSRWPLVCQLVVMSPLLSRCHRLSSSQHAASTSCPLNMLPPRHDRPPPPHDMPPPLVCWRLFSHLPLFCRLVVTSHLVRPPPQVSILDPRLHSHRLVVASHLVALLLPNILSSTPPPLDVQATHLPFASRLPQKVACVFDLVCPISWFMANRVRNSCQRYAPTYLYTTGGGGVYLICPYAKKKKIWFI
jgi:hypothetical protein